MRTLGWTALALFLSFWMVGCASQPLVVADSTSPTTLSSPDFVYTFVLEDQETLRLWIQLDIKGDADGTTDLRSGRNFGPLLNVPQFIEDVRISSAGKPLNVLRIEENQWRVTHPASAALSVSWRVNTRNAEETGPPRDVFYRPFLDRFGMHIFGVTVLLVPTDHEGRYGTLKWRGFDGWNTASGAQIEVVENVSFTTFVRSTFVAGPKLAVLERPLQGGLLRVGILGEFAFENHMLANELQAIVTMQRDYFQDHADPYVFVSVLENGPEFDVHATQRFETGSNLLRSFATMFRGEATLVGKKSMNTHHLLIHEMLHNWIGSRIYSVEGGSVKAAWFVEGFTHLLTWTILKKTGLATPEQLDRTIQRISENYTKNPFKNAPNSIAGPEFFQGPEGHDIAYNRGALIAAWLALRLKEHGTDLSTFLREMVARAAEKPFNEQTLRSFVAESTNVATAHLMFSFALEGRTIENPRTILETYFALVPDPP